MIAPAANPVEEFLNRAFARTTGAAPRQGNRVKILCDGAQNYPAWLEAIASARKWIHFESYIIHDDDVGQRFAEALAERARDGVTVRVLYDWWGSFRLLPRKYRRVMHAAGVDQRVVNPPHFGSPLAWLSRDHRKTIAVDGRIGYVSGLCVGKAWVGERAWRDTGVEIEGPAVADIERAFASLWDSLGDPLPDEEQPSADEIPRAGSLPVRVIASVPASAGLYRLDQLVATAARKTLWLTDAYFIATSAYVQALRAAAADGVDVRLLVPGSTDVPGVRAISRAGYRPLLEGGVRVFEWNGSMLHAKTAVADGRWARVGSTNLNPTSWLGNWELDVSIENEEFAHEMEAMYERDLTRSTEIVIGEHRRVCPVPPPTARDRVQAPRRRRSYGRATAGAIGIGNVVGAALTARRRLGAAEARLLGGASALSAGIAIVAFLWPRAVAIPVAILLVWIALSLFARAVQLHRIASKS
jgi:cardiolipin synthase A/B